MPGFDSVCSVGTYLTEDMSCADCHESCTGGCSGSEETDCFDEPRDGTSVRIVANSGAASELLFGEAPSADGDDVPLSDFTLARHVGPGLREEGELILAQSGIEVLKVRQHRVETSHLKTREGLSFLPDPVDLPPCDASRRGELHFIAGDCDTDGDQMFVCACVGSQTFKWRPLLFNGLGAGPATCGNGVQEDGEECDDGRFNANSPDTCRPDCTAPRCGDGIEDQAEECEPDETALCTSECKLVDESLTSCAAILAADSSAQTGFYHINLLGTSTRVHCVMDADWDGGGWTAVVDPANGIKPDFELVGDSSGGYISGDTAFGVVTTNSVNRGGNGYQQIKFSVAHPAFTEVRVHFLYGEQCQRWDESDARNMVSFDWVQPGTTTDVNWLEILWPRADGSSEPSHCFYVDVAGIHSSGPVQASFSKPASTATTVAFGSECGTTDCSMTGEYAQYKDFYVR